jgi:hypothetical protein
MTVVFPGESAEYRSARNRLLEQEIELRRAMGAVAAARRQLPPGGVVPQDYVFQTQGPGGRPAEVRLSDLFAPGKDSLVIYSMMFPRDPGDDSPGPAGGRTALLPLAEGPCPSCTSTAPARFRQSWSSLVLVERADTIRPVLKFAVPRPGERLPPEDRGGTGGYTDLLEALANPAHQEEHEQYRQWAGEGFNPEAFDLAVTNAALQRLR